MQVILEPHLGKNGSEMWWQVKLLCSPWWEHSRWSLGLSWCLRRETISGRYFWLIVWMNLQSIVSSHLHTELQCFVSSELTKHCRLGGLNSGCMSTLCVGTLPKTTANLRACLFWSQIPCGGGPGIGVVSDKFSGFLDVHQGWVALSPTFSWHRWDSGPLAEKPACTVCLAPTGSLKCMGLGWPHFPCSCSLSRM